jgi:4-hydroxy-4-methyl-2-oxoglutarate aldolase
MIVSWTPRMETANQVKPEVIDFLRKTDTCSVSNAIETFNVRMRNEGFIQGGVKCMFPALPPVAGYAITGRIRTTAPPIAGLCYYQNIEWWQYIASVPGPKIIVLADMDRAPGVGAFFGEIHAQISKALGCVGYVTNGAVRDLAALEAARFQCFAGNVSVSHAYAHIVEMGEAVEIGSLKILPGDLLHADRHGVQTIPKQNASQLQTAVSDIASRERELIRLCTHPTFSLEKLVGELKRGKL